MATLLFEPFHSSVDPEFWQIFEKKKLTEFKLDNSQKAIVGTINAGGKHENISAKLKIGWESFDAKINEDLFTYQTKGKIQIANTMEEFKNYDLLKILTASGVSLVKSIQDKSWLADPNQLNSFILISFGDLKAHCHIYWFGFPAIVPQEENITVEIPKEKLDSETDKAKFLHPFLPIADLYEQDSELPIEERMETMDPKLKEICASHLNFESEFQKFRSACHEEGQKPCYFLIKEQGKSNFSFHKLAEHEKLFQEEQKDQNTKIHLGFIDTSSIKGVPGWGLRNFLIAASETFKRRSFSVFGVREVPARNNLTHTFFADKVMVPEKLFEDSNPKVIGWEKNKKGKLAPRKADISSQMDPVKLGESSVSLNIQLMKWRMFPQLDLDMLSKTRCLLIGSGTLGCYVSRILLGWSIFNITLVDRAKVSYSNPVRQPLFEFEDCLNGGKPKAQCAADHLKKIYPKINVQAYDLDIPMPGHGTLSDDVEEVKKSVDLLTKLIDEHDVIFLLTDTREARWLPTMIAASKEKPVINSALGFDSYLVMRHGMFSHADPQKQRLGCYFCNDVVAPTNSLKDRAIDQQCTVTRPGVSSIASALAVEMMVACLHHPRGFNAKGETISNFYDPEASGLGLVPHQIRGSVMTYDHTLLCGEAYPQCVACSYSVIEKYEKEGFEFLRSVFLNSLVLEELTGLKELHEKTRKMLEDAESIEVAEGEDEDKDFDII